MWQTALVYSRCLLNTSCSGPSYCIDETHAGGGTWNLGCRGRPSHLTSAPPQPLQPVWRPHLYIIRDWGLAPQSWPSDTQGRCAPCQLFHLNQITSQPGSGQSRPESMPPPPLRVLPAPREAGWWEAGAGGEALAAGWHGMGLQHRPWHTRLLPSRALLGG